ncbi:O-antigen ligase family protein [Vibrio splendidus]|uniref:O-antigen ligase family protein n=1 Tax=Vibrio splendidus TaxID=29497 RepID=UPI0011B22574|nr:O-antigen ligase family protein [Vibrio splendidus]
MTAASISIDKLMLFVIFLILPIFDAANGILVINGLIEEGGIFSPSQLGRAMLMVLVISIVLRSRLSIIPFLLLYYLISIELIYGFLHGQIYGFLLGIITVQKLVYILLVALVMEHILAKGEKEQLYFFKLLQVNLLVLSLCLIFSTITGIGNSTYGWGFGTKSFFSSGNGLGLYLGIGTTILIGIKRHFFSKLSFKIILICSISVALIGTKTALIFCIVNLFLLFWTTRYRVFIFICLLAVLSFAMSSIIDVINVIFEVITARLSNSENIISYFGSGRIEYVVTAFDNFWEGDGNVFRLLFGSGALISFHSTVQTPFYDILETDLFDLMFMYGLFSVFFYLGLSLAICVKLIRYPIFFLAFLLLLGHSIIAGHVIFNGMSSVCFAILYAISTNLKRLNKC